MEMGEFVKKVQKFWEYGAGRTALAALCAHSVSISIGICQGYSAILIPQLMASDDFDIGDEESSWLASLGAITNPIGSILSGVLAEYFGRKKSIQISSIPFIIGWILIYLSQSIPLLYAGRLISGIAAGMSSACYTYVSEISNPENRGILQALGPICASFGILLTYVLGYYLPWNVIATVNIVFAVFTLVSVQFLPESPEYLGKIGEYTKAFDSYQYFKRSISSAQNEVNKHQTCEKKRDDSNNLDSCKEAWFAPSTVKPFMILVILFFLQELSGIYTILFYAVNFFEEANLKIDNYLSSIIVGLIRFIMSLVTAYLINKYTRKILCQISSFGMFLTMTALFSYYKWFTNDKIDLLPLICIILNVFFSMIGMLPIPWILVGELFPLHVRSIMTGVVICIAQCFIFICVKIYPDMIKFLGFTTTLAVFGGASLAAFAFSKFVLPETKNKTLEEIEQYFSNSKKVGYDNDGFVVIPERLGDVYTINVGN